MLDRDSFRIPPAHRGHSFSWRHRRLFFTVASNSKSSFSKPQTTSSHRRNIDIGQSAEPDMSTYDGINMVPVLGPLYWGACCLHWGCEVLLNTPVGTLVSMV